MGITKGGMNTRIKLKTWQKNSQINKKEREVDGALKVKTEGSCQEMEW